MVTQSVKERNEFVNRVAQGEFNLHYGPEGREGRSGLSRRDIRILDEDFSRFGVIGTLGRSIFRVGQQNTPAQGLLGSNTPELRRQPTRF